VTIAPGSWLALHWRTLIVYAVAAALAAALVAGTVAVAIVDSRVLDLVVGLGWGFVFLVALAVASLVLGVRQAEEAQSFVAGRPPDDHVRRLHATQNKPVINEMTIAGPIKEGVTRPMTMRIALWVVARVAEGLPWLRGGITIPTVATARWIAADEGRRLIFISNYTNASEPYVRDFIDVDEGAMRINLVFGFGRGYPRTRWVLYDGAVEDPNSFIHVVNSNQLVTAFWFCPYRDMSIDNIRINRQIREGLVADFTEPDAAAWLALL
jgi:hypothetical protein